MSSGVAPRAAGRTPQHEDWSHRVLQRWGDPEVLQQYDSLPQEKRGHLLATLEKFLEDTCRDLLADFRPQGGRAHGGPPVSAGPVQSDGPKSLRARIRQCRRGSPGPQIQTAGPALWRGLPAFDEVHERVDPLQVLLSFSVGWRLVYRELLEVLQDKHIPSFGRQKRGHAIFEEQQELSSRQWRTGPLGLHGGFATCRRLPCGARSSGKIFCMHKAPSVDFSDMSVFYAEEGAVCSATLMSEPGVSPAGHVMQVARDGQGNLLRLMFHGQLPYGEANDMLVELARAKFSRGTKVSIMEPLLQISPEGLLGIEIGPGEARLSGPGPGLADARSLGNKAVTSQQYALAAEFYCLGLQSPETETLATLLSNRCQALLKMRDYDAAAADAALALQLRAHDAKAWSRYVMAAGGLAALSVAGRGEEYSAGPEKAEIAEVLVEDWRLVTCRAAACSTAFAAAGPGTSPVAPNAVAAKRAIEVAKEAANAEYNKQNYSAAVEGYTKATASDPCLADVAAIFSNLAHCRLCLGQPHCAIASAVSCLRLRPSWAVAVKAVHRLAAALASTGEHDAARQVIRTFDSAVVDDVPEAVRKSCADLCSKLDRHAETLAELTASQGQPDHWESLLEGLLPGSEWCSGSLEASGGRLRVRSPTPRGSLLLLLKPLGGLAQGSDSWSHGELARHYVRSDGWGLHERLSSICNTDVAAKEVALLITGALGRVADPRELMLSSPRAQLLPLLGQRLESFFRSFGTLSPWAAFSRSTV